MFNDGLTFVIRNTHAEATGLFVNTSSVYYQPKRQKKKKKSNHMK